MKNCTEVLKEIRRLLTRFITNYNKLRQPALSQTAVETSVRVLNRPMSLQIEKIRCDSVEFDRPSLRILIESIVELAKNARLKQLEDRFSFHLPWLFRVPRFHVLVP